MGFQAHAIHYYTSDGQKKTRYKATEFGEDGWFDVLQGFDNLLVCATLTGPNGFLYEFDFKSDLLEWLTECSYLIGWTHTFGSEFDYGEYTLKLLFSDGARETYTRNLQKTRHSGRYGQIPASLREENLIGADPRHAQRLSKGAS